MTFWLYKPSRLITSSKFLLTNNDDTGDLINVCFLFLAYVAFWMHKNKLLKDNMVALVSLGLVITLMGLLITSDTSQDNVQPRAEQYTSLDTSLSID